MPITQNSKIQVRSGLQSNLPLLSKGELGWAVDSQRLYIGNGSIEDGSPFVGNTEIITTASASQLVGITPVSGELTGIKNGVNIIFSMPYDNIITNSLVIWDNFPLIPGIGYTVSGSTITFTTPPSKNDYLYFQGWIYSAA